MNVFAPDPVTVPDGLETPDFRLRMLTVNDVVKDFDAVVSSAESIRGVFGPRSDWPPASLTLEQNLIDLGWHQKEFQRRSSFTYTVVSPDERRCLGCVYIYPSEKAAFDAKVILWARSDVPDAGLERRLFKAVKQWLSADWWFERVAYPGREPGWAEWEKLPDKPD